MIGPGRSPVAQFELVDHHGRHVSERTFLGRHVLVFFGFTRCRMVCPRALTKLSAVLDRLGPAAERVTPLYVTVDSERDDSDAMRAFLAPWPRFLGLTGSEAGIGSAMRSFRVFAQRAKGSVEEHQLTHSSFTHLLDPAGRHVDHWGDHLCDSEVFERMVPHLTAGDPPTLGKQA